VGLADIAAIVEQDPAMSIKVLQLVNSAYFGLAHRYHFDSAGGPAHRLQTIKGLALIARLHDGGDGAR
jgi:hypothetical protein